MQFKTSSFSLVLLCSILFCKPAISQLTVNTNVTAQQMIETIVGEGFLISNVRSTCPAEAMGTFDGTAANIGIPNGILLTTGKASMAVGPNSEGSAGFNHGDPSDSQLDSLYKTFTSDACAIEFDFIPACDKFEIKYAFGSEEYLENVGKEFNDVFAFFISGPGIAGKKNIAVVPGTTSYVSINNINPRKNAQYYQDNAGGTSIQYDGFTKPMVASEKVIPCSSYHLKIVIADVIDGIFDSGVFIEGNSIDCAPVAYSDMASNVSPITNCKDGSYTFCRTGDISTPYVIKYIIGGTAINGTDYEMIPDSVIIPAGEKCATVKIIPFSSSIPRPPKTITITYPFGFCPQIETLSLTLTDPVPLDAGPDAIICSGDTAKIGIVPVTGTNYTWTPSTGLDNPNISNPKVSLNNNSSGDLKMKYTLKSFSDISKCTLYDTVEVTVRQHPIASFSPPASVCLGKDITFTDTSVPIPGADINQWYWEFGNGLFDTGKAPTIKYSTPGTFDVKLTVKDESGCADDTTMQVSVWELPKVNFSYINACVDDTVRFTNLSTVSGSNTIAQSIWNFGDSTPLYNGMSPSHLYPKNTNLFYVTLIIVSDKNCLSTLERPITLNVKPKVVFDADPVCISSATRFNNQSEGAISKWTFDDGTFSDVRNPHHTFNSVGTHIVKLVIKNNYGCIDSLTKQIIINDKPKFDFVAENTAGCPTFCTKFNAKPISGSDSIISWVWKFNTADTKIGQNVVKCYSAKDNYPQTLIATSDKGCKDTLIKSSTITVYPLPKAGFEVTPAEITIYDPKAIILDKSSTDVVHWSWNLGDGTKMVDVNKIKHTYAPIAAGYTITLKVINQFGCVDSTFGSVYIQSDATVFIPNAFTPGEDGKNDKFLVYASGTLKEAKFKMYIFDRWGNKLFTSNSLNEGWDGAYKGEICQRDVYVYSVTFTSEEDGTLLEKFRGKVTLVR